ncbi:MAG: hypothetical protein ACRDVP_03500 [Acidimicrobiales bacterium]
MQSIRGLSRGVLTPAVDRVDTASRRPRADLNGGATLSVLVLADIEGELIGVDLRSGALIRIRSPKQSEGELVSRFEVVDVRLALDPETDDLAQPEAATAADKPQAVGSLSPRRVRRLLRGVVAPPSGPLLGFPGPSLPYWEFRGARPSVALVPPARGPQLIARPKDARTWVRFGWNREDVWLPMVATDAGAALSTAHRDRLSGKALAVALGFRPQYLLVALSGPRDRHCYKFCAAVLPRG